VDFYVQEFVRTGFRGVLNWYRNIDRNWDLSAPFSGVRVTVPALYLPGDRQTSSTIHKSRSTALRMAADAWR
jgi:hypothetical protein